MSAPRISALLAAALLMVSGCGKKGPLIYPDLLIAQPPQHLTVVQSGAVLRLVFDLPTRDMAGRKLGDLESVQIGRRVFKDKDCTSCQEQYQEVKKIDLAFPAPAQRLGDRLIWVDSDVRNGEQYQYRLKMLQKGGVAGSAATTALASIQALPAPPAIKARAVFGGLIVVEIAGVPTNESDLLGYRLYRSEGTSPIQPLVSLTPGTLRYEDQAVQHGVVYRYGAKMLVKRKDGVVAESETSELVSISVVDDPK